MKRPTALTTYGPDWKRPPRLWLPSSLSTSTCTDYWSEVRTELSVWCWNGTVFLSELHSWTRDGHRQRWVPQTWGGGGAGCRTLGLCLLRGSVGALFGQWTPRFLFSRSTSPLSNTTQHSKTVQSRQLPPWVSISAACFCKPQFWRWATPSASVPVF